MYSRRKSILLRLLLDKRTFFRELTAELVCFSFNFRKSRLCMHSCIQSCFLFYSLPLFYFISSLKSRAIFSEIQGETNVRTY